jgi:glycosyl transferase family 2
MDRAPIYVGVTTLPSRIARLRPTIDSLLAQSLVPDRIFVSVPLRSVREDREYAVPLWLAAPPPGVELVRCATDYGPGTKLLGCLPRIASDACLILVDDDMVYQPFLVERLAQAQLARKDTAFSFHVFRVGRFECGQAADGFSLWTPNLEGIEAFAARALRSRHLFVEDDYWLSVFLRSRGISVVSLAPTLPPDAYVWTRTHADGQLSGLTGDLRRSKVLREGTRFLVLRGSLPGRQRLACALTYAEWVLQSLWHRVRRPFERRRPGGDGSGRS